MGCFLACFGISKKRKRRKPFSNVVALDQGRHGRSYVPLDSSVFINLESTENPINSDSEFSKCKEKSGSKIKKKVRFNLNLQVYEPIPTDYHFLESYEDEENEKKTPNGSSTACPSNYRYRNCRDSYDHEEEETEFEESDLDNDDDYEDCDVNFQNLSPENLEPQNMVSLTESLGTNQNGRDRKQYVQCVLNPVENLAQWKAIKSGAAPIKHCRQENEAYTQKKPPKQEEIAVDGSLSNWLFLPTSTLSEATRISRKNISSKEIKVVFIEQN